LLTVRQPRNPVDAVSPGFVNKPSPGSLVRFVGWLVLCSPLVAAAIVNAG
jgi:hypothetical protein